MHCKSKFEIYDFGESKARIVRLGFCSHDADRNRLIVGHAVYVVAMLITTLAHSENIQCCISL